MMEPTYQTAGGAVDTWHDCYCDGWQFLLVPEAFQHPAKMSKALADRIYQHATEQGWLRRGDVVVEVTPEILAQLTSEIAKHQYRELSNGPT